MRKPNWIANEFDVLLANPHLSSEELADRLPMQTKDAIQIVRNGIPSFHTGKDTSMLSKMMSNRLDADSPSVICPICRKMI